MHVSLAVRQHHRLTQSNSKKTALVQAIGFSVREQDFAKAARGIVENGIIHILLCAVKWLQRLRYSSRFTVPCTRSLYLFIGIRQQTHQPMGSLTLSRYFSLLGCLLRWPNCTCRFVWNWDLADSRNLRRGTVSVRNRATEQRAEYNG